MQLKLVFWALSQALGSQRQVSMCLCRALVPAPATPFPVAHHCLSHGFTISVVPHFHHKYLVQVQLCTWTLPLSWGQCCYPGSKTGASLHLPHFSISSPCRISGSNLLQRYMGGKMVSVATPALQRDWKLRSKGEFWPGVTSGFPAWSRCVFPMCDWWRPQQVRHSSKPEGVCTSLLTSQERWWAPGPLVITHLTLDSSPQLLPWSFPWGNASLSPCEVKLTGTSLFFFSPPSC